ncbi:glycerophosphodiester phosphodiesterase GDPDL7 [Quillaja saponaria]|uniref:glycerophosphodiester phosphodiesterase n=1 Tax=Quillaja saponaria TaxID=32244 RepID=A0AAD7VL14_QUISA|nr:glycerophosphodiester phosphodiesterase GDPDL7 [Quillaja saponaria]
MLQGKKKMIRCLFFISLLIHTTLAQKAPKNPPHDVPQAPAKKWLTHSGNQPEVVARGGFYGLFPEASLPAISMAMQTSLQDMVVLCNLQMTKDGVGFCLSDIRLENSTNIALVYPKGQKTYKVNGKDVRGWFAVDYVADELLSNVTLIQNIFSRPSLFDSLYPVSTIEAVQDANISKFWLNVQYDAFYTQHKVSVLEYVQAALKFAPIEIISSPEIGFLKSLKVNKGTKLIFEFLDANEVEPTTNQTYGSIVKDLARVKSFASGIVVPKGYIWPVNPDKYLGAPTTLVSDAHKLGLEVYASGFANDITASYNYSYDPSNEYLQFIDNAEFSVDGVITDFPPTASQAIACFAQNRNGTKPRKGQPLVISSNGASGVYPGSTDLSYHQAVEDGADIIDCSVQMTKDGVAFCLDSADLMGDTTAMTSFMSRTSSVPEIQNNSGIFSFDLSWTEIQSLKQTPAKKNSGKFITLAEFLDFAKAKAVTGVLINIQNAAYLASKKGLDIVGAVNTALSNATLDKQSTQQIMIQSDDSSVLSKFKHVPTYKRVLFINEKIGNAPKQTVEEIKKYADAVNVPRSSVVEISDSFATRFTSVVKDMHAANISVYVHVLMNEFINVPFDYFSDPTVELATYVQGGLVDGVVTDYPATASRYLGSPCSNPDDTSLPYTILPAEPGALVDSVQNPEAKPPAAAPLPPLEVADVVDPPLPPVTNVATNGPPAAAPAPPASGALANVANFGLSLVAILVFSVLSVRH